jgi:hypothetical protein
VTLGARVRCTLVFLFALVTGCYAPGYNTYSTARTTPPRSVQAAVYVQATGHSGEVDGERKPDIALFPPGVSGRVGIVERLDAGFHLGILGLDWGSVLGGDVKWLALSGDALDLAFDPGLDWSYLNTLDLGPAPGETSTGGEPHHGFYLFRAPIVTGMNLSRRVAVVLTSGFVYGWPTPELALQPGDRSRLVDGVAPLVGLGINFRTGAHSAFHPEATFVFSTDENERRVIYTLGFALQFGRLPRTLGVGQEGPPAQSNDVEPRRTP